MNRTVSASLLRAGLAGVLALTGAARAQVAAPVVPAGAGPDTVAPQIVVRVRSAAEFVSAARIPSPPPMPPMLVPEVNDADFLELEDNGRFRSVLDLDELVDVLSDRLDALGFGDDASLDRRGALITFQGSPNAASAFDAAFDALRGVAPARVEVHVRLYELDPGASGSGRGGNRRLVWEGRATGPSGKPLALGSGTRTRYLRDYDVEVAQLTKVGVAKTSEFFEGVSVVVVPHALAGSQEVMLMTQAVTAAQSAPMQVRDTGIEGVPSLDVPHLEVCALTSSAKVEDGGSTEIVVSGLGSEGRSLALVVEARRASVGKAVDGLVVLPVSALQAPGLQAGYVAPRSDEQPWWFANVAPEHVATVGDPNGPGVMGSDDVQDLLYMALGEWIEADKASVRVLGEHLVVTGDAEACERARQVVGELEQSLVRNGTLELQLPLTDAARDVEGPDLQRLSIPGLRGRTHTVVRGIESSDVAAYFVEVAQESSILDPLMLPAFRGVIASAQLRDAANDGVAGTVELQFVETGPVRRRPTESNSGESLDVRATHSVAVSHDGVIAAEGMRLGDGPRIEREGQSWRSAVVLKAR